MNEAEIFLRELRTWQLIVEAAGLFWLAAEMLILWIVISGRTFLEGVRLPSPRSCVLNGLPWIAIFLLLALGTFPRLLIPIDADVLQVRAAILQHFSVWTCFVLGWVLLEALIVYHGWRAYRVISDELRGVPKSGTVSRNPGFVTQLAILLFVALTLAVTHLDSVAPEPEFVSNVGSAQEVPAALRDYQNGVYLVLRIAGVAWITVEWIAVLFLVRGYFLLRRHVPAKGSLAHG